MQSNQVTSFQEGQERREKLARHLEREKNLAASGTVHRDEMI